MAACAAWTAICAAGRSPRTRRYRWETYVNRSLMGLFSSCSIMPSLPYTDNTRSFFLLLGDQLQAHEPALAADVEQSVRQNRRRPARLLEQELTVVVGLTVGLGGAQRHGRHLVVLLGIDLQQAQLAVLAQADEVTIDQEQRRPCQSSLAPHYLARR